MTLALQTSPTEPETATLTPLQLKAANLILEGHTLESAAKLAGCHSSSIDRWLRTPKFKAFIDSAKDGLFQITASKLARSAVLSVDVLTEIMNDSDNAASTRCKAAEIILNSAVKIAEFSSLNDRIAQIELTLINGVTRNG